MTWGTCSLSSCEITPCTATFHAPLYWIHFLINYRGINDSFGCIHGSHVFINNWLVWTWPQPFLRLLEYTPINQSDFHDDMWRMDGYCPLEYIQLSVKLLSSKWCTCGNFPDVDALCLNCGFTVGGIGHNISSFLFEQSELESMFFILCFAYGNHVDPEDSDLIRLFSHALFLCDQNNLQVHRYTLKYAVKFLPTFHSFAVALSSSLEYAFFLSVLSRGNYLNFLRLYINLVCCWQLLRLTHSSSWRIWCSCSE